MISSLVAMSLIDVIGAANILSSMPKRGVMFLRRAITTITWRAAEPDASAFPFPLFRQLAGRSFLSVPAL